MKSSEIAVLQESIESVELKGKKVKVTCKDNNSGKEVEDIIDENLATLCGIGKAKVRNFIYFGCGHRVFTIKLDSKNAASSLKETLDAIISGTSSLNQYEPDVDPVTGERTSQPVAGGSNALLIAALLIVIVAAGIFIWKRKR